jgi:hypothetical protein
VKTLFQTFAEMLPFENPYNDFDHSKYKLDIEGGTKHQVFEIIIDQLLPASPTVYPCLAWLCSHMIYVCFGIRDLKYHLHDGQSTTGLVIVLGGNKD